MFNWTGNASLYTIEFNTFWTRSDLAPLIYDGPITQLFPDLPELTQRMRDEIKDHFYYRQIGEETPQKFLRHLHQICRLRASTWARLLDTETVLRPEDALYNYDMTESATYARHDDATGEYTNTGESRGETTSYISDTPDGSLSDIENYMSEGQRSGTLGQTQGAGDSENHTQSGGESTLTRRGNIGIMTSAQILGGYRDAQRWDAWENVIFAELEPLFLGVF